MKQGKKKEFLEEIRKMPIINYVCELIGVSRNSYYRWRKLDQKFAKQADEALIEGENTINDFAESELINMIQSHNWSAINFWLRNRNPKFRTKIDINADVQNINLEYSPEERKQLEQAIIKLNQR